MRKIIFLIIIILILASCAPIKRIETPYFEAEIEVSRINK